MGVGDGEAGAEDDVSADARVNPVAVSKGVRIERSSRGTMRFTCESYRLVNRKATDNSSAKAHWVPVGY